MAKPTITTKDKSQDATAAPAVSANPGAQSRALATWQEFEGALAQRESEIAALLPQHVSKGRFISSAIAAVKQNPDLLLASPRSLMSAVTKSAQDGLIPDGREGVITAYGGEAKWNPMAYGLRKRARELDGILIDAQVVHENDDFVWHQGDSPRIEHIPAQLGTLRGKLIGVYAIFKREDGTVLHREVMDEFQIEAVKGQSKAPRSLMWMSFTDEAWRKTVVRRGIKSVPVSEKLEEIVRRDDDQFDFSHGTGPVIDGDTLIPPRPQQSDFERKADAPKPKPDDKGKDQSGDGRPEPPIEGEIVTREETPKGGKATAKPPVEREEPVAEAEDPPADGKHMVDAEGWLDAYKEGIDGVDDLADFKAAGRQVIEALEGLNDDERDGLRGQLATIVLTEQRRRGAKKK